MEKMLYALNRLAKANDFILTDDPEGNLLLDKENLDGEAFLLNLNNVSFIEEIESDENRYSKCKNFKTAFESSLTEIKSSFTRNRETFLLNEEIESVLRVNKRRSNTIDIDILNWDCFENEVWTVNRVILLDNKYFSGKYLVTSIKLCFDKKHDLRSKIGLEKVS